MSVSRILLPICFPPETKKKKLKNKYEIYEEAGVFEYWLQGPKETTILKYVVVVKVNFGLRD